MRPLAGVDALRNSRTNAKFWKFLERHRAALLIVPHSVGVPPTLYSTISLTKNYYLQFT